MSNYTTENLVPVLNPENGVPAIRIGDQVFTMVTSGGSATNFYKCATVDTVNETWTGYKAVLSGGSYGYASSATSGLSCGSGFIPQAGKVYADGALIEAHLFEGIPHGAIFNEPLTNAGNLTNQGVTFATDAELGRAVACFDGSSYLSTLSNVLDAMLMQGSWTFACWLYQTGTSTIPYIYSMSKNWGWGFPVSMAQLYIHRAGSDFSLYTSDISDSWHCILLTYASETVTVYIDGVSQGTINVDLVPESLDSWTHYIGSWQAGTQPLTSGSKMANVRFWDRVLNSAEIAQLAAEFTPTQA